MTVTTSAKSTPELPRDARVVLERVEVHLMPAGEEEYFFHGYAGSREEARALVDERMRLGVREDALLVLERRHYTPIGAISKEEFLPL